MKANAVGLNFDEKKTCSNDKFCAFVENQVHFTPEEVDHLQATILNKKLSRILYVSTTLAVWSMVAAWMDAVILPLLIVYAISFPGSAYYPILFPVVWTILNATSKFIYIRKQLGKAVTVRDNLLAVLPYAGAAFLLKNWFVGDPLLRKASMGYIGHQKKVAVKKLVGLVKKNS